MSHIEYVSECEKPYLRLTLTLAEAQVLRAALGEHGVESITSAIEVGDYGELSCLTADQRGDIAYDLFVALDDALDAPEPGTAVNGMAHEVEGWGV